MMKVENRMECVTKDVESFQVLNIVSCWWSRLIQEDGVLMLEASFVFPIVFYCSIAIILFTVFIYQIILFSHAATLTAERGAAFWDNSYKDGKTGAYIAGKRDRLYWRLLEDNLLQGLLSKRLANTATIVSLPITSNGSTLSEKKLIRAGKLLPVVYQGEIKFDHVHIERKITVSLQQRQKQTAFERFTGQHLSFVRSAVASVVEPVEFIRSIELARVMVTKLKQWSGEGMTKEQVNKILHQPF